MFSGSLKRRRARRGGPLRILAWILAVPLLTALLAVAILFTGLWRQSLRGRPVSAGDVTAARRAEQRIALATDGGESLILFGDLHVHTEFSADARVFGLPLFDGEGAHPPADACDFARFCSALDFWSINDHAEQMLPEQWQETRRSVRACNEAAGPGEPDTVAFLGFEWSQSGLTPSEHYGHRNVVFRDTADDATPDRPIAASRLNPWAWIGGVLSLADRLPLAEYVDYHRYLFEGLVGDRCPDGVPVRELPSDCLEIAETPDRLFAKLDDWGMPSLVIPHGLAWGVTNPAGATLDHQLGGMHDPSLQRLLEVYSGHGASEQWRDIRHLEVDAAGEPHCPEPSDGFTPCCWRAGEIVRARCDDPAGEACETRVRSARSEALGGLRLGDTGASLEGASPEDWLDCGQLRDAFLPAFSYRPRQSAQYALALRSDDATGSEGSGRFRFGLIGSSDNHRARGGSGYKEVGLGAMSDGNRPTPDWVRDDQGMGARLVRAMTAPGRADSFYYTGGLVAVHAAGRSRAQIFDALARREVYGTSGPRIQLWFDAITAQGTSHPMGSEVRIRSGSEIRIGSGSEIRIGSGSEVHGASAPLRFHVRASGARIQRPGCPRSVLERLGAERMQSLCLNECHFPGEERTPIERIEVVRIRPGRPLPGAIEDPWRVFPCRGDQEGCQVEFEDPEPASGDRLYYVRALQAPTGAINGDPLNCERDEQGRCLRSEPCVATGFDEPVPAGCRAPVRERAWSSPIFVEAGEPPS